MASSRAYGAGLAELPELIVLSKRDLLPDDEVEALVAAWRERLGASDGPRRLLGDRRRARRAAQRDPRRGARRDAVAGARPRRRLRGRAHHSTARRRARATPSSAEPDGAFRVHGRGVELLVERHDLSNHEALSYLERRLTEIGVVAALRSAGFEPGDEVRIGDEAFELDSSG